MKFPLALILAAGLASPAVALSSDQKQACDAIGQLARVVMIQRQAGMPLEQLLPLAAAAEGKAREVSENMIRGAYAEPRYAGQSAQDAATDRFVETSIANCRASF